MGISPQIRVSEGQTVPMPAGVKDTVATDTATPWIAAPPDGAPLSLEQYAYLYAAQLTSKEALAEALAATSLDEARYAAWQAHWESRMMHEHDDRTRFFALVAKLRG